jgi:acyl carrier protein
MGLDTVELVLAVEKRFSITIPNEAAARLATVGQMHQFIVEQLQREGSREPSRDEVYSILTEGICDQLGVRREDVTPYAHFVYDLGAD